MPSVKTLTPILGGRYFHIFNRGINKQSIFFESKNYDYFLKLIEEFLIEYTDVFAYCLMSNHFHLVLKVKDVIFKEKDDILADEEQIGKIVTNQLRRLFITYSMAINKQEKRTGNFFDRSFKRLEITSQEYLEYVIFYTHFNPEKHGVITNFRKYKYSSYKAILASAKTNIDREFVIDLFGGKDEFLNYHNVMHEEKENVVLE
ncbi:MAG: hypothetical protein HN955_03995 [Prolixibacteraceae bacterium]|jgi:putative transposase|nr:hypothetical protein [Prolixibacteraceae bacterium]MBT6997584.1 hypothetical protein [Prolixibacteraceae bacterium]